MSKKQFIQSYYEPRLCEGKADYEKLGWETQEAQFIRFQMLTDSLDLHGKELLDVGCGLGCLLDFLKDKKITVHYTGMDILPSMITEAGKRHPDADFILTDIFSENPCLAANYDIVYSSGIFNLNLGNNADFLPFAIQRLVSCTREALVFNLLHKRSENRDDRYFYYHPDEVRSILTPILPEHSTVEIIDEYLPNDFTVVCTLNKTVSTVNTTSGQDLFRNTEWF